MLDLEAVRAHFPALASGDVFMDNAGGSQILGSVVDRIRDFLLTSNVQLGATYPASVLAAERMAEAQARIAEFMNAARPDEIVFGPSSTQLLQTLARGLAPSLGPGDEIVVTRADHESNIGPWIALEAAGVTVRFWEFDATSGQLELPGLDQVLSPRTRLVAVTHVSNIFGGIVPVAEVAARAHAAGALIAVDGVAWAPHRAIDVRAWDVDFYVCSLYKVYGPHHAALYGRHDRLIDLANQYHYFISDRQVPYKLQPGNPNYELSYGSAGIADYLVELGQMTGAASGDSRRAHIETAFAAIAAHEAALCERLMGYLGSRRGVRVVGPGSADADTRVPTVSFTADGRDPAAVVRHMDTLGIGIRFGHFHARRLIDALGLARSNGVVRVSMVHYNTLTEVDRLVAGLDQALDAA